MIIDVTGFGWSGSGAVIDLFKEYNDVEHPVVNGWEFNLLHCVDGIYDLDWKLNNKHCRFLDSSVAIKRFLSLAKKYEEMDNFQYRRIFGGNFYQWCEEYIDSIIDIKFRANSSFDLIYFPPNDLLKWINRLLFRFGRLKGIGSRIMDLGTEKNKYFAYNSENFDKNTHRFMRKIINALRKDPNKPLIMDHMFSPDCPLLFFKYIDEDIKCIIVRRDPRDTYLLAKYVYKGRIPLPVDNVEDFIKFYKKSVEDTWVTDSSEIMNIQFEDLVYNYDDTISKIEAFTGVSNHYKVKRNFNPAISVNNTHLYKKYSEYSEDIKKIESALPQSLYKFDTCSSVESISEVVF